VTGVSGSRSLVVAVLMGAALLVACLAGAACGGSTSFDETRATDTTISGGTDWVETTQLTEAVTMTVQAPGYSTSGRYTYDSGYVVSVEVTVWDPVAIGAGSAAVHPAGSGWSLQPGVDLNPSTDCVVPGKVTMKNETPGWSVDSPSLRMHLYHTGERYSESRHVGYFADLIVNLSGGPGSYCYTANNASLGSDNIQVDQYAIDSSRPFITRDSPLGVEQSISLGCFVIVRLQPDPRAQLDC
jgi:hypothetical protein